MASSQPRYFIDTSYLLAFLDVDDAHHQVASAWADLFEDHPVDLLTHEGILAEIGDGYSGVSRRKLGIRILRSLETDPRIEIAPFDTQLARAARELYYSRPDRGWGLTDCASFVLMRECGISLALSADRHFLQAGFRALLLEGPPPATL